ncbi:MAG: hypothetical protein PVF17_05995 [Ignavibacteria bacterium]|jgi:spermidine synthase
MRQYKFLIVALLSISLLSLELIWTRLFSAEFFYTFAFLVLSLAILGLGLGALSLRLFPFLNNENKLWIYLSLCGLMMFAGPPLTFLLKIDFTLLYSNPLMIGKFIVVSALLSSSFFLGGMALALIFKQNNQEIPKLYMADLVGAGLGVAFAMLMMNSVGTPLATFLISLPVFIAAIMTSKTFLKLIPLLMCSGIIFLAPYADELLEVKREDKAPVIYQHWDAMSKIKIFEYDSTYRRINIDNAANTGVNGFDGKFDYPDSMKWGLHIVDYLINQYDSCTFLSLGAGGGQDVFMALQDGAAEIHAVEVNPQINELMLNGELAEFSGYIYRNPKVKVVTEDARAYVRRFHDKFDFIYSFSSNSYAALASGAFALSENYIYTTEAFKDYWNALTNDGILLMENHFYVPRFVSEVRIALEELGIENINQHFAVYNFPNMSRNMLLLSKQLLTNELLSNAVGEIPPDSWQYIHLLYPAPDSLKDNLIDLIVNRGWEEASDSSLIDISPSSDNRPYIAQLGLWKNFSWDKLSEVKPFEFFGFPISKINIVIILLIITVLIMPLNFLPYLFKGDKLKIIPWLYFFLIGMAFMIVEIILIQKYTLFIGPSVYSLITILLTLLIASGIGSRFSDRISDKVAFGAIILWLLLDIVIFKYLFYGLGHFELIPRILVTIIFIAPVGFFMGMPFPKAGLRVGKLIDWGFAVNGTASVFGSTLIILIAISFGFDFVLLLGALLYAGAFFLLIKKQNWS